MKKAAQANKAVVNTIHALDEIRSLKNALSDLLPTTDYTPTQINNLQTLAINNRYSPLTLNRTLLSYLYCEHGILQTAIQQPVLDALRGGVDIISTDLDGTDIKKVQDFLEHNSILKTVAKAETWKRLFGGAGLIVNVGQNPEEPLNISEIGSNIAFYAADRWELVGANRMVEHFNFYGVKLHRSRVMTLIGKEAPSIIRNQLAGWGMSEAERMVRDLNAYLKNKDLAFELMDESKIDVYRINGFNNALLTAAGTARIERRIQIANQLKNYRNAVIMDKEDEYDQKQLTYSGLPDMVKESRIGIASALKMPMTKLFGISASGFNAGEDDIENYNAMIESEVRDDMRQLLRVVLSITMQHLFGFVPEFDFRFKPLRVMSEKDEEDINRSRQERIMSLYNAGFLKPEEVGQCLSKYKLLPVETEIEQGLLTDPQPPAMARQAEPGSEPPPAGDEGNA